MNVWSDRILEVAREDQDGIVSVGELTEHELIRTSRSTISRHCSRLKDHGLLRQVKEGVYVITEEGQGYLNERYDADEGVWIDSEGTQEGEDESGVSV